MSRLPRLSTIAVTFTLVFALTGCGRGSEVVRFDGSPGQSVTSSALDHWMRAIAGAEIRRNLGAEGPAGLVSEPADDRRCFAAAKLVAPRSFFNQLRYDRVQVSEKCRELHSAIKNQALSFLIAGHWMTAEAARRGVTASRSEIEEALETMTGGPPDNEGLGRYLMERHWALADLLYRATLNVLGGKLHWRESRRIPEIGHEYTAFLQEHRKALIEKTVCRAGYAAPGCRGYVGPKFPSPPSARLIELLTGKATPRPNGNT